MPWLSNTIWMAQFDSLVMHPSEPLGLDIPNLQIVAMQVVEFFRKSGQ